MPFSARTNAFLTILVRPQLKTGSRFITLPFHARDPKAIEIVQVILESILLRREKNMRDSHGNRIVELPPKEDVIETLHFSAAEQKFYDSIYDTAKRKFDQLNAQGLVGKNYTHILAMLMRSVVDRRSPILWLTSSYPAYDALYCTQISSWTPKNG